MKILVVGAGRMGSEITKELAKSSEVETVGVVDVDRRSLDRARLKAQSNKVRTLPIHQESHFMLKELMADFDVGVIALSNRLASYRAIEAALDARLNIVDILEEYHRRPDTEEAEGMAAPAGMSLREYGDLLHRRAVDADVAILDGLGFAPGLSNVLVGEGIRKLDAAETAVARVGGIPDRESAARHPLGYMITWSFDHVLREYTVDVPVIRAGKNSVVPALSERECFRFQEFGLDVELECAITPGMPSFMFTRPDLMQFAEKTIRWPGHWDAIQTLKECGLLSLDPTTLADGSRSVAPRSFLASVLQPRLEPEPHDRDIAVMWNTVTGQKDGRPARVDSYLWEEADAARETSAMARVTAFPAVIGALLLGRGEIENRGIVAPEDGIRGRAFHTFVDELDRRGVQVKEVLSFA